MSAARSDPSTVGDPVVVRYGKAFTLDRVQDFSVKTALGDVAFERTYVSDDSATTVFSRPLAGVPRVFGASPGDVDALRWTSNFYSLVDARGLPDGGGTWRVFSPEAEVYTFKPCTGTCWAAPVGETVGRGVRLKRSGSQFELLDGDRRAVYAAPLAGTGRTFLSSVYRGDGKLLASLAYAAPDAGACWLATASAGVPYVSTVTLTGGPQLAFVYERGRALDAGVDECVLARVDAVAGARVPLARYGVDAGLITTATALDPLGGGALWVESYDYSTGYAVSRAGTILVRHNGTTVDAGEDSFGTYAIGAAVPDAGVTCPANTCCIGTYARTVQLSAQAGDGTTADPQLTRAYAYLKNAGLLSVTESCTGSACSPGTTQYLTRNLVDAGWGFECSSTAPGFTAAVQNKRGYWSSSRGVLSDGGLEVVASYAGVTGVSGVPDESTALERVSYAYSYNAGVQSVSTETRPSTVAPGLNATTTYVRNSSTNALERVEVSGYTKLLDGGVVARTARTSWAYDSSGRVTREAGPCEGGGSACGTAAPSTEYEYHGATGTFSAGRLWKVKRKATATSTPLTTTFDDYTPLGEPQRVTDENGVVTLFGYAGHQVASRVVAEANDAGVKPEWLYTWENERLTSIRFPEGNYEVYCYRATTSPSCSGAWTGRLMSRTRAADASASSWSERVEYTYWPDGTLKTESSSTPSGVRVQRSFAADAHRRPTLTTVGQGAGSYSGVRAYDGADNVVGLGSGYNAAPGFCGGPGALSQLCVQLGYDAADRLRQMDGFPAPGDTAQSRRVCLDYDAQGNVNRVTAGCSSREPCATDGSPTTCDGVASNTYLTDDFGNVVEASLAGTDNGDGEPGVFRFEFDVRGNLVKSQTEVQRSSVPSRYVLHEYDLLNRRTATKEVWSSSPSTPYVVARWAWDDDAADILDPDVQCGVAPLRTMGRLRAVADPLFNRWYQYDAEGRVTMEARLPATEKTCAPSAHLVLGYTLNGNLASMRYGHGREVHYGYGTGALTDREESISVGVFLAGGTVTQRTLIDGITWEPYGGLRSYQLNFPRNNSGRATVERELGAAATVSASDCPVGALSETNDMTGRVRSIRVADAEQEFYRRTYSWEAEEVARITSCYLGGPDAVVEDYRRDESGSFGYDGVGQLRGVNAPNFETNGGPMRETRIQYDTRGNATMVLLSPWDHGYAFEYDGSARTRRDWVKSLVAQNTAIGDRMDLSYDRDGRVTKLEGLVDSSGTGPRVMLGYQPGTAAEVGPGSETVMRTSSIGPSTAAMMTYTYWYDASNRRQAKVYPQNNIQDVFLYDLGHQLLEDRGNESLSPGGNFIVDEYIWLGGSPVAVYRASLDGKELAHLPDDRGHCSRLGDDVACGVYFLVTDHIGKPVLVLNDERGIAGAGEYAPSGMVNRMPWQWGTAHPYPKTAEGPYWLALSQREYGMELDFRVHFPMVDTEQDCGGQVREGPSIWDQPWGTMYELLGGYNKGDVWSSWVRAPRRGTGWRGLTVGWGTLAGNCEPGCSSACPRTSGEGWNYAGFTMREYEYRRYQEGATPYFPALRFPGHYYDAETDLHENLNRYYYPMGMRYLSPEPLLQSPAYVRRMAQKGMSVPTYAYAANNPLRYTDPTGLFISTRIRIEQDEPGAGTCRPGQAACNVWDVGPIDMLTECRALPAMTCGNGQGRFGFDVRIRFDTYFAFLVDPSTPVTRPQVAGSTVGEHERIHRSDVISAIQGINGSVQTEGFATMSECEAARSQILASAYSFLSGAAAASERLRDP